MFALTRVYTRPNLEVVWHFEALPPPLGFSMRFNEYKFSQKIITDSFKLAPDGLSITFIMIFSDQQAYTEYDTDPVLNEYWEIRKSYNDNNGIIAGPKLTTMLGN